MQRTLPMLAGMFTLLAACGDRAADATPAPAARRLTLTYFTMHG